MEWRSVFTLSVPLLEVFVRGTVTYLVLLILLRLVGRREAGGLGVTDVLLVVLVAQAAAAGLQGEAETVADGLLLVVTILFWSVAVDAVAYRFPCMAALLKARPRVLIENGRLNRKAMLRGFMTAEEVLSQMRLHGIEDIAMVERAWIEPNGMISVIRRDRAAGDPVEPPRGL